MGPFATIVDNDEGALPIWFQSSFLEGSLKDKVSLAESPWFDEFYLLTKCPMMVLGHSDDCSSPDSIGINASAPNVSV